MDKSKTLNAAEQLREVSRQLEELVKSGRTKRTLTKHKKERHSQSTQRS